MSRVKPADIEWSWGFRHHSGNLWKAVRNAAGRIPPAGLFHIVAHERTAESRYWINVMRPYNAASPFRRRLMELSYVYGSFLRTISPAYLLHNFPSIRDYRALRGMAFWTDVRDWPGGWPYEPTTPAEATGFCEKTLGFRTAKVKGGKANAEYLFTRG